MRHTRLRFLLIALLIPFMGCGGILQLTSNSKEVPHQFVAAEESNLAIDAGNHADNQSHTAAQKQDVNVAQTTSAAAMQIFITSLKKRDMRTFLTLFSRSKPWRFALMQIDGGKVTLNKPAMTVTYAQITADLRKRSDFYGRFFASDDFHAVSENPWDEVRESNLKMWKKIAGDKFALNQDGFPYVKWRNEKGRWVIDELGESVS